MSAKMYQFPAPSDADDLYDYARPQVAACRASSVARSSDGRARSWNPEITDDWPDRIPVSEAELDLFEAHFGGLLDELFGPTN